MFALINTFHGDQYNYGIVISRHRTEDTAHRAATSHARAVERANGRGSYVPTMVVEIDKSIKVGDYVPRD